MNGILEYIPGDSIIHRANPITKLALALGVCASAFISDRILYLLLLLLVNLGIGAIGGAFKKAVSVLKAMGKAAILLIILQVLFIRSGNTIFLFVTDEGIVSAIKIALRLMDATMPLVLVLAMTQMTDLANALVAVLHLPYKYAFTLITAMKFIPLFVSELRGIMEAQTARGVEFDAKGIVKRVQLTLPLCIPLLLTSVRKADANAMAVELRGFYLRNRHSAYKKYPFGTADLLVGGATVIMIVLSFL